MSCLYPSRFLPSFGKIICSVCNRPVDQYTLSPTSQFASYKLACSCHGETIENTVDRYCLEGALTGAGCIVVGFPQCPTNTIEKAKEEQPDFLGKRKLDLD